MLLQIIIESENNEQQSLLTNAVLKQLIRFYDGDMQYFVGKYLEQSLAMFLDQQDSLRNMMKSMIQHSPLYVFTRFMEKNTNPRKGASGRPSDKDEKEASD